MATDIGDLGGKLDNIANKLAAAGTPSNPYAKRIILSGLKAVEGNLKSRIFNDGLDANLTKIGTYSTAPMLAGKSSFRTKTAANKVLGSKAKRKGLKWVTYKGKSLYVEEGGYKAIREKSGLQASYVDLDFKGDLRGQIKVGTFGDELVLGHTNSDKAEIAKALESPKKYNRSIFAGSSADIKLAEIAVTAEIDAIIEELLK